MRHLLLPAVLLLAGCPLATVESLCGKCQTCYATDPGFQEGWCADHWDYDSETFDRSACNVYGQLDELDLVVFAFELDAMTCEEFDLRI